MTYDQSVRYLFTLGRELASPLQARAAKFDLLNITAVCERLGHPDRGFKSVHVAGTNGKGSTAAMIESVARVSGVRTGMYSSPHLLRINERIRIDGEDIADSDFAQSFDRVHAVIEELLASGALAAHPTFFECITAMAFDSLAQAKVDLAVIEVGMGGRLDSTNIIAPEVAVITPIDFDHENFLGHSIAEIAREKAGIIKTGAWVVSAAGHPAAQEVIRRRSAEQQARLIDVASVARASNLRSEDGCYRFTATTDLPGTADRSVEVRLPLAGRFQVQNALTAITAARLLAERGFPITDEGISNGLGSVRWPGRLERLQSTPAVYVDGTHNPAGARELAGFWDEQFAGRRIHLVYGAMRDKAVDEVAGLLFPRAASVILTQSRQPRALSAEALASMTRHLADSVEIVAEPSTALERAFEKAGPEDVVFVTGSLYLVGDICRYWETRTAGAETAAIHPSSR